MKELLKSVKDYEGVYKISNLGRIRSLDRFCKTKSGGLKPINGRVLKTKLDNDGYYVINLHKQGKVKTQKIHKLVAIAFLNHIPCGMKLVVDHINNIKTDNMLINLQVITTRENCSKDQKNRSSKYIGVTWNKKE